MRLVCCELSGFVGIVAVSIETGVSVDRLRRYFAKRGLKLSESPSCRGFMVYDSRLVQDALRDFEPERDFETEGSM